MTSTNATDDFTVVTAADLSTIEDDEFEIIDVASTFAATSPDEQVSVDGELKDVVERTSNSVTVKGVFIGDHFSSLEVSRPAMLHFDAQH